MKPPLPRVLLITDPIVCPDTLKTVHSALQGGVSHILLRAKTVSDHALKDLGLKLLTLTHSFGSHLLIHERVDIALTLKAAGVHLPEWGMETKQARSLLNHDQLLGRSCHSVETANKALQEGADFVTLSPLFKTQSHPEAIPLGVQEFSKMCRLINGPVLALGGIGSHTILDALKTGAYGVALIRGILDTPNPHHSAKSIMCHFQ